MLQRKKETHWPELCFTSEITADVTRLDPGAETMKADVTEEEMGLCVPLKRRCSSAVIQSFSFIWFAQTRCDWLKELKCSETETLELCCSFQIRLKMLTEVVWTLKTTYTWPFSQKFYTEGFRDVMWSHFTWMFLYITCRPNTMSLERVRRGNHTLTRSTH